MRTSCCTTQTINTDLYDAKGYMHMLDMKMRNVTDILNLEYLQEIQDALGRIVGITTVLLDPNGVPVSQPTNLHSFCAMMQASETGVQMCIATNARLMEINRRTRERAVATCPNSGLQTAAVPIFLKEEFLGSWLIGQIRTDEVDRALIERSAVKAGLSVEAAHANISKLPVITKAEFGNVLDFLTTVTKALTDMVETNANVTSINEELTRLTQQLDASLRAFRQFIDLTNVGTYLIDYHTGELIMYNSIYKEAMLNNNTEEHPKCFQAMGYDDFCPFCPKSQLVDASGNPTDAYTWENYVESAGKWLNITSRVIHWIDGRLAIMTTYNDITERKREEERMRYIAYNDLRLGIPNGPKLELDVQECAGRDTYLICFDISGLRKINHVYGRDAGDGLLHEITTWLKTITGYEMTTYRIEGDDFCILVKNSNEQMAFNLADRIHQRFAHPFAVTCGEFTHTLFAGVHIGIMNLPAPFESHSTMLNTIERVQSLASKSSKPLLVDEQLDASANENVQLEISLKTCILNKMQGFSLNYQPIVAASSGKWIGLEALCRWECPITGPVSPGVFIEKAEQLGLINALTDWVIEEAIGQAAQWKLYEKLHFMLHLNISPLLLKDYDILGTVNAALKKHNYPAKNLSLEITESAEVHFDEQTLAQLKDIKRAGISLSLDDFGVGYASFSNLSVLPFDMLKTDRSFVIGIENDAFLQGAVQTMVDYAHSAGLLVVAEGIETDEQRDIMNGIGVNMIQGFYFSRPLTKQAVEDNLDCFREI